MKRAGAFILVLLAIAHLAGVMPFSLYFMQEVKTEAKIKLSNSSGLTRVLVNSNEYNDSRIFQLTDEGEFMYRGRMYDFKSMAKEGDEYVFYALEDDKETTLVGFLKNVFEQSTDQSNNTKSPFGNLFKTFEKDFIHHLAQNSLAELPVKYSSIAIVTSDLSDCHSNVIFHPPA